MEPSTQIDCLGPMPVRRAPRRALPRGAWDTHAHVFGPTNHFAYRAERAYTPPDATVQTYLGLLDALGVDCGVLVQPSVYGTDNTCLLAGLAQAPDRLRGIVALDVQTCRVKDLRDLRARGVRGLRINAASASFDPQSLDQAARTAAAAGWHIALQVKHLGQAAVLVPMLETLAAPVVVEAMGKIRGDTPRDDPDLRTLLDSVARGRLWIKLTHAYKLSATGMPYGDTAWIARTLVAARSDRMLWGLDWPHPRTNPMPADEDLVDLLDAWIPAADARRAVLVENPTRLYE